MFRNARLQIHITKEKITVTHEAGPEIAIRLYEDVYLLAPQQVMERSLKVC
ncbi:hypothetical protein D3C75_1332630 [compost metagenome]